MADAPRTFESGTPLVRSIYTLMADSEDVAELSRPDMLPEV
jgi:hypothetical protein